MDTVLNVALLVVALVVAAFAMWATRRRHKQGLLKRYGIPGPEPGLFFGNWLEYKKDRIKVMEEWARLYGKVYGFYEGETPKVVISDMDAIKECFVKLSGSFTDRPPLVANIEPIRSSLIGLKGDEWKALRGMLNPCFTTAKIKRMLDTIHQCSDTMVNVLNEHLSTERGATVNVSNLCQGLSLDVITKCALGWQSICQRKKEDPLIQTIAKILTDSGNWIHDVCMVAPCVGAIVPYIFPFLSYGKLFKHIEKRLQRLIETRKVAKTAAADIVQLLLEAQKTASDVRNVQIVPASTLSRDTKPKTFLLSDKHIVSNCFVFMAAGFDTTATTLSLILYVLATHPEEQGKLHDHLMSTFADRESLTYEELQKLKRFDAVIAECLRLYPPLILTTARVCPADTHVSTGHIIPRGSHVLLPTWNILHDTNLWADPHIFNPDRFSERFENNLPAASGFAFGIGPRECIGKRLAQLELKVALSKLVRRFQFTVCKDTPLPLKLGVPLISILPEHDIVLRVHKRTGVE